MFKFYYFLSWNSWCVGFWEICSSFAAFLLPSISFSSFYPFNGVYRNCDFSLEWCDDGLSSCSKIFWWLLTVRVGLSLLKRVPLSLWLGEIEALEPAISANGRFWLFSSDDSISLEVLGRAWDLTEIRLLEESIGLISYSNYKFW